MKILCKHQYVPLVQEPKKLDSNKKPFGRIRVVTLTTAILCLKCAKVELLDKSLKEFRIF